MCRLGSNPYQLNSTQRRRRWNIIQCKAWFICINASLFSQSRRKLWCYIYCKHNFTNHCTFFYDKSIRFSANLYTVSGLFCVHIKVDGLLFHRVSSLPRAVVLHLNFWKDILRYIAYCCSRYQITFALIHCGVVVCRVPSASLFHRLCIKFVFYERTTSVGSNSQWSFNARSHWFNKVWD